MCSPVLKWTRRSLVFNFHERVASPRMVKQNLGAAHGCLMSCKSIGALSAHANLMPAINSYPKLLPLSTHSNQGRVLLQEHWQFGRLAAHSRLVLLCLVFRAEKFPMHCYRVRGASGEILSQ
jgi:hypothetical protein